VLITYNRPQDLDPKQLDPAAPAADLDPAGYERQAETVDVLGTPWNCTRRRAHSDDEHRAVFSQLGDGPTEANTIAPDVPSSFREPDPDHVRVAVTSATRPAGLSGVR